MKAHALRASLWKLLGFLALFAAVLVAQPVFAQEGTCIDDVTGTQNTCAANDVQLSTLTNSEATTCMLGESVTLSLRMRLLATSLERYDIGIFLALDGGNASTGSCQHDYLPPPLASGGTCSTSGGACKKTADCPAGETCTGGYNPDSGSGPFYNAEPEDPADQCGDLEQGVDTYYVLPSVTVKCIDSDGDGLLNIGTAVSWDSEKANTCTGVANAVPDTPARCRYETVDVANVTVAPAIIEVNKTAQPVQLLEPGGLVTFTFAVTNTSSITFTLEGLSDSVYGPLQQAGGNCSLPQLLNPGGTYVCAIHKEVTGAPSIHEDIATAWGTAWNKVTATGSDPAQVTIIGKPPPSGLGTPPGVVAGGLAAAGLLLVSAGVILRRRMA